MTRVIVTTATRLDAAVAYLQREYLSPEVREFYNDLVRAGRPIERSDGRSAAALRIHDAGPKR
jgi:hypothetical protein